MSSRATLIGLIVVFTGILAGATAAAQDQPTRAAQQAAAKAEKARTLEPYTAPLVESAIGALTSGAPRRLSPWSAGQFPGGGLSLGATLRVYPRADAFLDTQAAVSVRGFAIGEVAFIKPPTPTSSMLVRVSGGWRTAPQFPFHGLGRDSSSERFAAGVSETYLRMTLAKRYAGAAFIQGEAGARWMETSRGHGSRRKVEDHFGADIGGLGSSPQYLHAALDGGVDTRTSPGYSTVGGLYHARLSGFADASGQRLGFRRLDLEAVQLIPIVRAHWVLALRAATSSVSNGSGTIPWFMLPALGGGNMLRAYQIERFRDRHTLLVAAEWRTFLNRALEFAVFAEGGDVAPRVRALNVRTLAPSYGAGVRIHGPTQTVLRTDVAHGREGWRLVFNFGPAF